MVLTFSKISLSIQVMPILLQHYIDRVIKGFLIVVATNQIYVLQNLNLSHYSNIILNSFSILSFPKLCRHIGLTLLNKLAISYYPDPGTNQEGAWLM